MLRLSRDEGLILYSFHERAGDRSGAHAGQMLDRAALKQLKQRDPDLDIDAALEHLVSRGLVSQGDSGNLILTKEGERQLYPKHTGEGGVHTAA